MGHDDTRLIENLQDRPRWARAKGRTYAACWQLCKQMQAWIDSAPVSGQTWIYPVFSRQRADRVMEELHRVMRDQFPWLRALARFDDVRSLTVFLDADVKASAAASAAAPSYCVRIVASPDPHSIDRALVAFRAKLVDDLGEYREAFLEMFRPAVRAMLSGDKPDGR